LNLTRQLIVEPIGLDVETLPRPIVWENLFANPHPVEIEIGTGKGTFLTNQAKSRPEINFLGIEYAAWFWRYASDRLRRNACMNTRTVRAEAAFFFKEFVSDSSVDAIHIYFPDPWPKKRHHKRRLIQPPFLLEMHRVLKPAGRLQMVTDHAEYFEQMQQVLAASPLKRVDYIPPGSANEGEVVGTNFERKYREEGRPFFSTAAIKSDAP
jgi:tRNA (guanine-N7-)-methyltransferase